MKKLIFPLILLSLFTACGRGQSDEADFNENGYVFTISTPAGNQHMWVTEAAGKPRRFRSFQLKRRDIYE